MVIVGNETWLGGYATSGLWSEPPNNHVAWHVRDSGEGPGSTPDQISLQNVGVSSAYTANYCANAPTNLDLFDLEAGDIQIMRR